MTPTLALRPRKDRAFERLYSRHVQEIYRYALALLPSEEDAERVTRITFSNAYRAFGDGARPDTPGTWLLEIAHRLCRAHADDGPEEEEVADEILTSDDVGRALARLAFEHRATLALRELERRSCEEMAEILDLSPHAVETRLFGARRALNEELEHMLRCRCAQRAISRRLDGELDHAERRALRRHLRGCVDCRTFERSHRAQGAALRGLSSVVLPGTLSSFSP
jgi:DNA-directed RNA polymerase specialized sigma24 family protein